MNDVNRSPKELDERAVAVAALAAGITEVQARQALDAASILIRRAHTLRIVALLERLYANAPAGGEARVNVDLIIERLLGAVDRM
jgi:hypothetical protein